MDLLQAIENRHSVRAYSDKPIPEDIRLKLQAEIDICNTEGILNIQAVYDEPQAFGSILAHYGLFRNVRNYIAMIGKNDQDLDERIGYFGERIVLKAQQLGLNTCWVAATYKKVKAAYNVSSDEKLVCVIALGHGANQGKPHRSKAMNKLCKYDGEAPEWFMKGMNAAILAPTAVNQQKFCFTLAQENKVKAEITGGVLSKIDLGIAKLHFEIGAGADNFQWI